MTGFIALRERIPHDGESILVISTIGDGSGSRVIDGSLPG